ncbi:glycosyltransferase family 2 protein [Actinospica sp.]|jgi:cellulose synthase (UDP-forming)|uniref:glycosyltransferase family 2 protein n=1 Tax=Actinospica sp. TaxID=1872142 RepID=UPI002CF0362E|nr:glycosyltransferase family 2 protein [Actinospica sp.]HWG23912.1 glycosyltransferase family 2 protein [Actinospica sp.]
MSILEDERDETATTLVAIPGSDDTGAFTTPSVPSRLPHPPTDAETKLYDGRNRQLLMRVSVASFLVLTISQFRFVITEKPLLVLAPFFLFTVLYYVISLWVNIGTKDFDMAAHERLVAEWMPRDHPSLDVFLPICREDLEVLSNTWTGVSALMRRYPGLCTVYVLDDGADPEAAELAADFGFRYLTRPLDGENPRGWFKKAGNLRYGFSNSEGEFVLVLDADFNPRADLPRHLLPYMAAEPRLGIVQSPQFFRTHSGQTRMERGAGAVQELFYRLVQVSRDQRNGAICVGSCAIYRREALRENGGSTLIGHSEDVHTGFDLRRQGWDLRYVPVPLAAGLCPETPDAFFVQQYRWCMGSMDLLKHEKFWKHKLKLRTRCCYFSGFCYYLHTALFTVITPLIPLTMLLFLPDRVRLINYVFIAPSLIYNILIFPLWHRCRFGPSAYMAKLLYGWAHLFAIWDLLRGRPMGWKPTGGRGAGRKNRRLWIGIWAWSGGTCAVWVAVAALRTATSGLQFAPMFLLGLLNGWIVVLALMARREQAPGSVAS